MSDGEARIEEMAAAAGLLKPGEPIPEELLAFAFLLVHACAQIGDGYWQDDASAGQHIRAVFYP
ncbi:hypothetical protein [Paracidovorax cattleyae]|uniref:hypothetical protein n=1 Tax=Paracidovorax cattleyae TaxID=80868 RepID=UPI0018AFF503|nr:hypothetical protein [Paracidovorax cattleyae]MBF9265400.1 hypothetical protein [Paracidovorax cattleyae]UYL85501.1 hypothetical protein gp46c [Acidovorax phage Aval]